MNITLDSGHLTMRGTGKVQIKTSIQIYGTGTKMPVTIEADFTGIPHHLHQIYIQAMWSSYGDTNVYNNTEPEPKTIKEQKSEWRLNRIVDIISKAILKK